MLCDGSQGFASFSNASHQKKFKNHDFSYFFYEKTLVFHKMETSRITYSTKDIFFSIKRFLFSLSISFYENYSYGKGVFVSPEINL